MKGRLDASLVLGCNGSITNGFVLCNGTQNKIVDLSNLGEDDYLELLKFLENACGLFNSPVFDYNKCVNIVSLLYKNYCVIDQSMLFNIQNYFKMHRQCGIWIMLILNEDIRSLKNE
jgi:hypothetical protein